MLASKVRLSSLKTYDDHLNAINDIEADYLNSFGNLDHWCSGRTTTLRAGAVAKIQKINDRILSGVCTLHG